MTALRDKIAIVTGAGRGTGRALALKLAAAGARVVVNDVSEAPAAEVVQAICDAGGDAVLGALPSLKGDLPAPVKVNDAGHTDIARALRVAMASFPADRQKRIVLFSDGNQNVGDALREARIAAAQDVDIDVLLLAAAQGHEVMVDQLVLPTHVRKDAVFVVRAIISRCEKHSHAQGRRIVQRGRHRSPRR